MNLFMLFINFCILISVMQKQGCEYLTGGHYMEIVIKNIYKKINTVLHIFIKLNKEVFQLFIKIQLKLKVYLKCNSAQMKNPKQV